MMDDNPYSSPVSKPERPAPVYRRGRTGPSLVAFMTVATAAIVGVFIARAVWLLE